MTTSGGVLVHWLRGVWRNEKKVFLAIKSLYFGGGEDTLGRVKCIPPEEALGHDPLRKVRWSEIISGTSKEWPLPLATSTNTTLRIQVGGGGGGLRMPPT